METVRAEGIVVQIVRFRDADQIATAFTRDHGIIKLIVKAGMASAGKGGTALAALTRAEFVYQTGRGDIHRCQEVSLLDGLQELRQTYGHLSAACKLLEAIKASQVGDRPAPALYDLLMVYLKRLPELEDPEAAVASFRLKTLRHEGLLGDAQESATDDSQEIDLLAYCRAFTDLMLVKMTPQISQKVERLFRESLP